MSTEPQMRQERAISEIADVTLRYNGHTERALFAITQLGKQSVIVRGLTRRTLRSPRLRYPPNPLSPYILLHLIIVLLSFHCSYLFSPSDRTLRRTLPHSY